MNHRKTNLLFTFSFSSLLWRSRLILKIRSEVVQPEREEGTVERDKEKTAEA